MTDETRKLQEEARRVWDKAVGYLKTVPGKVDETVRRTAETSVLRMEIVGQRRDLEQANGPLDILDHAAPRLGAGGKLGIDATRKIPGEEVNGVSVDGDPPAGTAAAGPAMRAPSFGNGRCLFVGVDKQAAGDGLEAIEGAWEAGAELAVAVDASVDLDDWQQVLFHLCANADPGRDLHRADARVGFDATAKREGDERHGQPVRDYPPILEMDAEIVERVEQRWSEYGLD